jgi:hypothetical protein
VTAVERAEQAVTEAREALTVYAATTRTVTADGLAPHIDALVRAVRELDAEIVRADTGRRHRYGSADCANRHADLIHPTTQERPAVSARRPSRPWRLVLTTSGVAVERPHRSRKAVYEAAAQEREKSEAGITRVTRCAVEQ